MVAPDSTVDWSSPPNWADVDVVRLLVTDLRELSSGKNIDSGLEERKLGLILNTFDWIGASSVLS